MPASLELALVDHDGGVPSDVGADAAFEVLVAGEPRLFVGRDGVDVGGRDSGREADLGCSRPLEQLHEQEPGPVTTALLDDGVEGVEPLLGLGRVDVGNLVRVTVEDHPAILAPQGRPGSRRTGRDGTSAGGRPVTSLVTVATESSAYGRRCPSAVSRRRLHRRRLPREPRARWLGMGSVEGVVPERRRAADDQPAHGAVAVHQGGRAFPGHVRIVSDSTYVVNCFKNRWYIAWRANGWRNAQKKPVANKDLWEPLVEEVVDRRPGEIELAWVKGHAGNPMNELADLLATEAARLQRLSWAEPSVPGPVDVAS